MSTKLNEMVTRIKSEDGSALPYVLAWFMGVPGSLLFLIFVVRGCH